MTVAKLLMLQKIYSKRSVAIRNHNKKKQETILMRKPLKVKPFLFLIVLRSGEGLM